MGHLWLSFIAEADSQGVPEYTLSDYGLSQIQSRDQIQEYTLPQKVAFLKPVFLFGEECTWSLEHRNTAFDYQSNHFGVTVLY